MPYRYFKKGKPISRSEYNSLSNLKNSEKWLSKEYVAPPKKGYRVDVKVSNYGDRSHRLYLKSKQYVRASSRERARQTAFSRLTGMDFYLDISDYEIGVSRAEEPKKSETKWKHRSKKKWRKQEHSQEEWL